MDSLKIVLLADIHFGYSIGEKHAGLLVKKINAEDPDLICIAGDIFDNEYEGIKNPKKTAAILRSLKSRYGVYACWGNHDLSEPILAGLPSAMQKKIMMIPECGIFWNLPTFGFSMTKPSS